jgi:hypothetical protein
MHIYVPNSDLQQIQAGPKLALVCMIQPQNKFCLIRDRLWENPVKVARQNSEKNGKSNQKKSFFSEDAPLIHFIHPKVQKYILMCLKIAANGIKINSIPI